jgi:hypothetical protein
MTAVGSHSSADEEESYGAATAETLIRSARAAGTALTEKSRAARAAELERTLKWLVKSTAQQASRGIVDRHQRNVVRTDLYTQLLPLFRALSEAQSKASRRARRRLGLLIGVSAGALLLVFATISALAVA